jgi:hypothetical protein
MTHVRKPVLAICGGGNGAHALAVVASQTFGGDIVWLVSSEDRAEVLRQGIFSPDGLRSTGVISGAADKVRIISSMAAEVIPYADMVAIVAPAFAHAPILNRIAPHLQDEVLIGSLPTRGGFEFESTQILRGIDPQGGRIVFGLQTLPWTTRIHQPGRRVHIGSAKAKVLFASLPRHHADRLASELSHIFGTELVPTQGFLNMTLGNPGQAIHPGLMYGLFASWNGEAYREEFIPRFYADVTDEAGALVEQLSGDILAVTKAIETRSGGSLDLSGVLSIHDWLKLSYGAQTKDMHSVASSFRTGPNDTIKAPMLQCGDDAYVPNFRYRFLTEDVPFGLVVTKALAEIAGVETPAVDAIIHWTQSILGEKYLIDGKLALRALQRLPLPQNYGLSTVSQIVEWYAAGSEPMAWITASR